MIRCKAKPAKTRRSARNKAKQASTYQPTDITPEHFFQAWSRKRREALIEMLIDTFDAEDGDSDHEDEGCDEPVLAAPENHATVPYDSWWGLDPRRDKSGDQSHWAQGSSSDCEGDEHDGREPDDNEGGEAEKEDYEPSLGWTAAEAAFGTYAGTNGCIDLEEDAGNMGEFDLAESGIDDHDGLMEQVSGCDPHYLGIGFGRVVI